jgi:hypothetical protein
MRPRINDTWFGSITVEAKRYEHDILIRLSGKVDKRDKRLSRAVTGTAHIISRAEIEDLHRKKATRIIIGTGQQGMVKLSDEAVEYLKAHDCACELHPTPEAIRRWNEAEGKVLALFHVTC